MIYIRIEALPTPSCHWDYEICQIDSQRYRFIRFGQNISSRYSTNASVSTDCYLEGFKYKEIQLTSDQFEMLWDLAQLNHYYRYVQ